jgi:hypothetical protein
VKQSLWRKILGGINRAHEDMEGVEELGQRRRGIRDVAMRQSIGHQEIAELVVDARHRLVQESGDRYRAQTRGNTD